MKKMILLLGGVVVLIIISIVFSLLPTHKKSDTSSSKSSSKTQSSTQTKTTKTVTINANGFSPSTVTVKVGSRVIWVNADSANHSVTEAGYASDNPDYLGSKTLHQNNIFEHTFTRTGTHKYSCFYSDISGTVIVTN